MSEGTRLTKRTEAPTRSLRRKAAAAVLAAGISGGALVAFAGPAEATAGNCSWGLNTATTAWGHCNRVDSNGYCGFRLVVNCYFYPQQISYGSAPQSGLRQGRVS
jgi:hypothetical protein